MIFYHQALVSYDKLIYLYTILVRTFQIKINKYFSSMDPVSMIQAMIMFDNSILVLSRSPFQ